MFGNAAIPELRFAERHGPDEVALDYRLESGIGQKKRVNDYADSRCIWRKNEKKLLGMREWLWGQDRGDVETRWTHKAAEGVLLD